ncbi:MAG: DUF5011 domain-containing protein [Ruminococcus sp.]|jgi:hypothetical protein|nr:DUF5011 domain-containing protein [Ruminococcus sp.]
METKRNTVMKRGFVVCLLKSVNFKRLALLALAFIMMFGIPGGILKAEAADVNWIPQELHINGKPVQFVNYAKTTRNGTEPTSLNSYSRMDTDPGVTYRVNGWANTLSDKLSGASGNDHQVTYYMQALTGNDTNSNSNIYNMVVGDGVEYSVAAILDNKIDDRDWDEYSYNRIEFFNYTNNKIQYTGSAKDKSGVHKTYTSRYGYVNDTLDVTKIDKWITADHTSAPKFRYWGTNYDNWDGVETFQWDSARGIKVIGRDTKGPQIASVNIYEDYNKSNGAPVGSPVEIITTANQSKTYYIIVGFSEPITIAGASDTTMSGKTLEIQTMGSSESTAQKMQATFVKYTPSINDDMPYMVFSYKLPEARKTTEFNVSSLTVSENNNSWIYNTVTDMSGNPFNGRKGENDQKANSVNFGVQTLFDGVRLRISEIKVVPQELSNPNGTEQFIKGSKPVYVDVYFNKFIQGTPPKAVFELAYGNNSNVEVISSGIKVEALPNGNKYYVRYIVPVQNTSNFFEGNVRVKSFAYANSGRITSQYNGYTFDTSSFVSASTTYSPGLPYIIDRTKPTVTPGENLVFINEADDGASNVYSIEINYDDINLKAAGNIQFTVNTDYIGSQKIAYQLRNTNTPTAEWYEVTGSQLKFTTENMAVIGDTDKKVFLFFKVPNTGAEISYIEIDKAMMEDGAQNRSDTPVGGAKRYPVTPIIDTIAPEISLSTDFALIDDIKVKADIRDANTIDTVTVVWKTAQSANASEDAKNSISTVAPEEYTTYGMVIGENTATAEDPKSSTARHYAEMTIDAFDYQRPGSSDYYVGEALKLQANVFYYLTVGVKIEQDGSAPVYKTHHITIDNTSAAAVLSGTNYDGGTVTSLDTPLTFDIDYRKINDLKYFFVEADDSLADITVKNRLSKMHQFLDNETYREEILSLTNQSEDNIENQNDIITKRISLTAETPVLSLLNITSALESAVGNDWIRSFSDILPTPYYTGLKAGDLTRPVYLVVCYDTVYDDNGRVDNTVILQKIDTGLNNGGIDVFQTDLTTDVLAKNTGGTWSYKPDTFSFNSMDFDSYDVYGQTLDDINIYYEHINPELIGYTDNNIYNEDGKIIYRNASGPIYRYVNDALNVASLTGITTTRIQLTAPNGDLSRIKLTGTEGSANVSLVKRTFEVEDDFDGRLSSHVTDSPVYLDPYSRDTDIEFSFSLTSYSFDNIVAGSDVYETVYTYYLKDSDFIKINDTIGSYYADIPIDISEIDQVLWETDENGNHRAVIYEFRFTPVYADDEIGEAKTMSVFALSKGADKVLGTSLSLNSDTGDAIIPAVADIAVTTNFMEEVSPFGGKDMNDVFRDDTAENVDVPMLYLNDTDQYLTVNTNKPATDAYQQPTVRIGTAEYSYGNPILFTINSDGEIVKQSPYYHERVESETGTVGFTYDIEDLIDPNTIETDKKYRVYIRMPSFGENVEPVYYCFDLAYDSTPPEFEYTIDESDNKVTITLDSFTDDLSGAEKFELSYQTYDETIHDARTIRAELKAGESYILTENNLVRFMAQDKLGNLSQEYLSFSSIDNEAPWVMNNEYPTLDTNEHYITIPFNIQDQSRITDVQIKFSDAYMAAVNKYLTDQGLEAPEYFSIENIPGTRTPAVVVDTPATSKHSYLNEDSNNPEESYYYYKDFTLEFYIFPGYALGEVIVTVTDELGSVNEWKFSENLLDYTEMLYHSVPPAAITDSVYEYGGSIGFNIPVKLKTFTSTENEFSKTHSGLNITQNGTYTLDFTDRFGNMFSAPIIVNLYDDEYAHNIEFSETEPTNQNITVRVTTSDPVKVIDSGEEANTLTLTATNNGALTYTIKSAAGTDEREYSVNVNNIDKTPDEILVYSSVNGYETVDGDVTTIYGTETYTAFVAEGIGSFEDGINEYTIKSTSDTFTFTYTDEAGNVSTKTISGAGKIFNSPEDYDISYWVADFYAGGSIIGKYNSSDSGEFTLPVTNKDITAVVTAFNSDTTAIPAELTVTGSSDAGITAKTAQNTINFTVPGTANISLVAGNTVTGTVTVPAGTIDKEAPTGSVEYKIITAEEIIGGVTYDEDDVLVYFVPSDPAEVLRVTGDRVVKDGGRYFINLNNGTGGMFTLTDTAGNVGTVLAQAIYVAPKDETAPTITSERFLGVNETITQEMLLNTPTNNSLNLLIMFDEIIGDFEAVAYPSGINNAQAPDSSEYVSITKTGLQQVKVEFKKNCQVKLSIKDKEGNELLLTRPGVAITCIDKDKPIFIVNQTPHGGTEAISITADEPVLATGKDEDQIYKTEFTYEVKANGTYSYAFIDRAGNMGSISVPVTSIDDKAPLITTATTAIQSLDGKNEKNAVADVLTQTSGDMELAFNITDDSAATVVVVNTKAPEKELEVYDTPLGTYEGVSFSNAVRITENGIIKITATDATDKKTSVYVVINTIDKEAPVFSFESLSTMRVKKDSGLSALETELLEGVSATDRGAGLDGTVSVNVSGVNLAVTGTYTVTYSATDNIGNTATRSRTVIVADGLERSIIFGGDETVDAYELYNTTSSSLTFNTAVNIDRGVSIYNFYIAEGYRTKGQMKYADEYAAGSAYALDTEGYYTILAKNGDSDMFLVYVYYQPLN